MVRELRKLWKTSTAVIPVVVGGALGSWPNLKGVYLERLGGYTEEGDG